MTQIDYNRAAKYFLLQDVWQGFRLGMKYFYAPKATENYPQEKGQLSPPFQAEHAQWKELGYLPRDFNSRMAE